MRTRFSKPIPGQSLTATPGNSPWEKPPQFTNVDKAMDFLIDKMLNPKQVAKLNVLLERKVPLEILVQTILFAGFTEGKWTYDMMVLLAKPLSGLLLTIYAKLHNGKPPPVMRINNNGIDPGLASVMAQQSTLEGLDTAPKEQPPAAQTFRSGGLMGV
jgi:hypothetical protein